MISRPTTPQLIEAACAELTTKVGPAVTDPTVKVVLDMMVAVLQGAARRAGNEIAWMREEAAAIEALARRLAGELPAATALAGALDAYTSGRSEGLTLEEVVDDYGRASELLSCAAEAAFADGDPARKDAVRELLAQRLAHEGEVTGQFVAAGRT